MTRASCAEFEPSRLGMKCLLEAGRPVLWHYLGKARRASRFVSRHVHAFKNDRQQPTAMEVSHNATTGTIPYVLGYYELSWSILSTVGLGFALLGLMVAAITGPSLIIVIPIATSVATALANGLCYVAYYTLVPVRIQAGAAAVADVAWLAQEAGLSFYSYVILERMLCGRQRSVFLMLFWPGITCVVLLRAAILAHRICFVLGSKQSAHLLRVIGRLHIAYFSVIAAVEVVSAGFLLHKFRATLRDRRDVDAHATSRAPSTGQVGPGGAGGLCSYLMRSTETRLALLAFVGVMRAVTYSFQLTTPLHVAGSVGQLDRFFYTFECLFPMVLYCVGSLPPPTPCLSSSRRLIFFQSVDILACRLVFANDVSAWTRQCQCQYMVELKSPPPSWSQQLQTGQSRRTRLAGLAGSGAANMPRVGTGSSSAGSVVPPIPMRSAARRNLGESKEEANRCSLGFPDADATARPSSAVDS